MSKGGNASENIPYVLDGAVCLVRDQPIWIGGQNPLALHQRCVEVASVRSEELEIKDLPGWNAGGICRALYTFRILVALARSIPDYNLRFVHHDQSDFQGNSNKIAHSPGPNLETCGIAEVPPLDRTLERRQGDGLFRITHRSCWQREWYILAYVGFYTII